MTEGRESANIQLVQKYFEMGDGRIKGDINELFAPDVEIYIPKFGIERGAGVMMNLIEISTHRFCRMAHHIEDFNLLEFGDTIVVEGTTEGTTVAGLSWDGRETLGGRFCSVFEVSDGLISRMYVYADPDYCSEDTARYPYYQDDKVYR